MRARRSPVRPPKNPAAASGVLAALLLVPAAAADVPLLIAHRGASAAAPENTLAAFRLAWEEGADAIEGDFYLSADGKIVCIHDKTTKRTCPDAPDLPVAKTSFDDLRALDFGAWKGPEFAGERIPTLDEVLDVVPDGKGIFIEIKCGPEIVPVMQKVLATRDKPARDQLAIICFDADVIRACRKAMPEIDAHWLVAFERDAKTGAWSPTADTVVATLAALGATGVDLEAEAAAVDADFATRLRDGGFEFHCWTVDSVDLARKFRALGVDSITTNVPAALRAGLQSPPAEHPSPGP